MDNKENNTAPIVTAFKKLLGDGLAWLGLDDFADEFLTILALPLNDLKEHFKRLKYVHFPTKNLNENDIKNGEELFNIEDMENKTLQERAANIEGRWCAFGGSQTFKQIEAILIKKGFPIQIIENVPTNAYDKYGARNAGNGFLQTPKGLIDPILIKNGKHSFIIQAKDFMSQEQIKSMLETVATVRPGHNAFYFIPRFLRKKEIHGKMTKRQMQAIKKCQYCDVRTADGI